MKLYVGNLAYSCTEDRLREIFEAHGEVASAALVMDRETGRPRGFGFVEFNDDNNARAAIEALNGQNIDGRDLTLRRRPRRAPQRSRGGGLRCRSTRGFRRKASCSDSLLRALGHVILGLTSGRQKLRENWRRASAFDARPDSPVV